MSIGELYTLLALILVLIISLLLVVVEKESSGLGTVLVPVRRNEDPRRR
jgi:hypothetical protein